MNNMLKRTLAAICALSIAIAGGAMAACFGDPIESSGNSSGNGSVTNSGNNSVVNPDGSSGTNPGNSSVVNPDNSSGTIIDNKTVADLTYELGKQYIISHNEGENVTYVMEAENTNLGGKHGVGYSGNLDGKDLVITPSAMYNTQCSGGQMVNYLYRKGVSLNFFIVSDREVENAALTLRLSAEYMDMIIGNGTQLGAMYDYQIRVDQPSVDDLKDIAENGAWGAWDDYYLKYYEDNPNARDPDCADTYYITDWECTFIDDDENEQPGIRMDASKMGASLMECQNFTVTTRLKLYKGVTCISFITNGNSKPLSASGQPLGTMDAVAPVFDCIGITTDAQIGMYKPTANNNSTENACWIDYEGSIFGDDK